MIFHFSVVQIHFVFCSLNFIVLLKFLIEDYQFMFIIIVFKLTGDKVVCCLFCLSHVISHGM